MTDPARWLVLDLESLPGSDDPLVADVRALAGGTSPRLHDAGWARYLAAPVRVATVDLDALAARPGVHRAWLQDDDVVFTGRLWPNGAPGFEAAGWTSTGQELLLIAGPCAVETASQMDEIAAACAAAGARWFTRSAKTW